MELSIKQKTFIAEYLKDGNATRSAIAAGYSFSCDIKGYYVYLLVDPITVNGFKALIAGDNYA